MGKVLSCDRITRTFKFQLVMILFRKVLHGVDLVILYCKANLVSCYCVLLSEYTANHRFVWNLFLLEVTTCPFGHLRNQLVFIAVIKVLH